MREETGKPRETTDLGRATTTLPHANTRVHSRTAAVTSACLSMLGRLLYSQTNESTPCNPAYKILGVPDRHSGVNVRFYVFMCFFLLIAA